MLTAFDWLRRCESGAELIAALDLIKSAPHLFHDVPGTGPPPFGIAGPCIRCWIYPRVALSLHCKICHAVLSAAAGLGSFSRHCMVIWGFVNFLPDPVKRDIDPQRGRFYRVYLLDGAHFLAVVKGHELTGWLREILLYHGSELKGLLSLFPTVGKGGLHTMGDILCRAIQQDSRFPMDRLRVRFFSRPHQLNNPHKREKEGMLTFESSEFLNLLEIATIFRSRLHPEEQQMVKEVVKLTNHREKAFYWGRLMGALNTEARDMLSAWRFRQWPEGRVNLLYELIDHVPFTA
jgi:hypothetical protein